MSSVPLTPDVIASSTKTKPERPFTAVVRDENTGSEATIYGETLESVQHRAGMVRDQFAQARQREFVRQLNELDNLIIKEPIGSPYPMVKPSGMPPNIIAGLSPAGGAGVELLDPMDPVRQNEQARQAGIDMRAGFDERYLIGLTRNMKPEGRAWVLDKNIREDLKSAGINVSKDIPVAFKDSANQIVYLRPVKWSDVEKGERPENVGNIRISRANPPGLDYGDIMEGLPMWRTAPATIAGGVVGSAVSGGNPWAALSVSSAITFAVEGLAVPAEKAELARKMGVSVAELDQFAIDNKAMKQAMLSAGLEFGAGSVFMGVRALRNRNRFLADETDMEAFKKASDSVHERLVKLRSLGVDASPSSATIAAAIGVEAGATKGGSRLGLKIEGLKKLQQSGAKVKAAAQDNQFLAQLDDAYKRMTNQQVTAPNHAGRQYLIEENGLLVPSKDFTPQQRALRVLRALKNEEGIDLAKNAMAAARADVDRAISEIADATGDALFLEAQSVTAQKVRNAAAAESVAWKRFYDFIGLDDGAPLSATKIDNGPTSHIRIQVGRLKAEQRAALAESLGAMKKGLADDIDNLIGNPMLDVHQLQVLRSHLLQEARRIEMGTGLQYSRRDVLRIVSAIDKQVNTGAWMNVSRGAATIFDEPSLRRGRELWADARAISRYNFEVTKKGIVADITETNVVFDPNTYQPRKFADGRRDLIEFTRMPDKIRDDLMDPQKLRSILRASGDNPRVKAATAAEVLRLYKKAVRNQFGQEFMSSHVNFVSDPKFGNVMRQVLTDKEFAQIRGVKSFQEVLERKTQQILDIEKMFKNTYGTAWANGAPDSFARIVMGSNNKRYGALRRIMRTLDKRDPATATAVRAEVAQWLGEKMSKSPAQLKTGNAIRRVTKQYQNQMEAIFGKQHVKNLDKIARGLDVPEMSGIIKDVESPDSHSLFFVARNLIFGPLSRKERISRGIQRFQRLKGVTKAIDLMANPRMLENFMQLERYSGNQIVTRAIAMQLGLEEFLDLRGPSNDEIDAVIQSMPSITGTFAEQGE